MLPFGKPPYTQWHSRLEKKQRMELDLQLTSSSEEDSDDSELDESYYGKEYVQKVREEREKRRKQAEEESESSSESDGSSSTDSEEARQRHIQSLLPDTPDDGNPPKKKVYVFDDDDDLPPPPLTPLQKVWKYIVDWRARERARRMHYIFREYERRAVEYDQEVKEKLEAEMQANEKAVILEAYRSQQRKIRNSKQKADQKIGILKFTKDLRRRDEDARKMAFYCYNLQRWAGERGTEEDEGKMEKERALERKRIEDAPRLMREERDRRKAADNLVIEEDIRVTQEALRVMRRSGLVEGVNPKPAKNKSRAQFDPSTIAATATSNKNSKKGTKKSAPKDKVPENDSGSVVSASAASAMEEINVEISLNPAIDWSKKRNKRDFVPPFTVDILNNARSCRRLRGHTLGDRGALSLAAEFVKGACPVLEKLDLHSCEVSCRGFGRLMHGLKLGNVLTVQEMNLRGNFLRSRSIMYLQAAMESGVLDALRYIDLRDNELGEEGVDVLVRMIIKGALSNVTHLYLQRNGITDGGFNKIVRTVTTMGVVKCPRMERIGLEGNPISSQIKRQLYPLPPCISV